MAAEPTFSYQPPPGGDITLKSADCVTFLAHSMLLAMSSSVFADMISSATQSDIVELTDDAVSVSLMLRFIYPPTFMDDLQRSLLEKSLTIARKYDISGIITSVDHLMYDPANKGSPLKSDPVYTFCLATTYELPRTKKAAIEALRPERFGFADTKNIVSLAQNFPHASSAISLLGAHCVRTQKLMRLMFGDQRKKITPNLNYDSSGPELMICENCMGAPNDIELETIGDRVHREISWVAYWSIMAFHDLATRPLDQCGHLFSQDILNKIENKPNVCRDCIQAARNADDEFGFYDWAEGVRNEVEQIVKSVEDLYTI